MSDNKKQMMDIQKVKSFSVAVSDEHQRNWGDNLYSRKENDPKYNYDRSRTRHNFQVSKGGELGPIDKNKSITDKIEQAIKNRVTGRVNATSNRAVSIVFGGNREQMCELHSRLAEVNEKYGLERGDDITITGAKHKSTETYRRELADECRTLSNEVGMKKTLLSGLNRSITKAETKIKALQTMVGNLEKAEAEKQATIAELEDYMKNRLGDAV